MPVVFYQILFVKKFAWKAVIVIYYITSFTCPLQDVCYILIRVHTGTHTL